MKIDFLRPIIPYVLYHHERYDGKGYPFRLSGKDIPVEGRILAVIDTFDALINPRPYREAMSREMAMDELILQKGEQLDPDVVDIFVEVLRNPKNAFGFYFSGQTQDLSQRQGKDGWTKRSILF